MKNLPVTERELIIGVFILALAHIVFKDRRLITIPQKENTFSKSEPGLADQNPVETKAENPILQPETLDKTRA